MTNEELYVQQVGLLKTFLVHGAISQAQFDKSLGDLTRKMYPDGLPVRVREALKKSGKKTNT